MADRGSREIKPPSLAALAPAGARCHLRWQSAEAATTFLLGLKWSGSGCGRRGSHDDGVRNAAEVGVKICPILSIPGHLIRTFVNFH